MQEECFNPTQVRLRQVLQNAIPAPHIEFQSHTGTITTWIARYQAWVAKGFNPTQVRLRRPLLRNGMCSYTVSIPHRYDYDTLSFPIQPMRAHVSIPHRYDYDQLTSYSGRNRKKFQSHTGTITTDTPPRSALPPPPFQSHTGTITTQTGARIGRTITLFQSHTGTITTNGMAVRNPQRPEVSIPHRYDYD